MIIMRYNYIAFGRKRRKLGVLLYDYEVQVGFVLFLPHNKQLIPPLYFILFERIINTK